MRSPGRSGRPRRPGASAPLAVLTVAGVVAVAIIGVVLLLALRNAGIEHEKREAADEARLIGDAVVGPAVTAATLRGEAAALAALDQVVEEHVLRGHIARVRLWTPDGRIVYSDQPELIGERFVLQADEREVLASGGVTSDLSDLSRPENRLEQRDKRLLEVYTRVAGPDGPLLFEVYQHFESLAASSRELWLTLLPALLGGLVLLQLTNLAIARWFARHSRYRDQQRAALLAKALDASATERRRIAADLHDGVVQDLTAASVTIAAATHALNTDVVGAQTVTMLQSATETVRGTIGTLRTLLIDFYPADMEARGLVSTLGDLVALARTRGLVAELNVPPHLRAPVPVEGLLYRVAQEALRNVVTHARARTVVVSAGADDRCYWLAVADDGEGFDTDRGVPEGHIGLRVVRDLVADAGGRLVVQSRRGEGTIARAELPRT
jgi:two-component system NarL family sensor kinase